jgi:hypothetical protein
MSISLENQKYVVFFCGQKRTLPGEFDAFDDARRAGEDYCQKLGWIG